MDDGTLTYRVLVISFLALIAWLLMIAVDQLAALRVPIRAVYYTNDNPIRRRDKGEE